MTIKDLKLNIINFANNLITFAKLQQIATGKLLGRSTAGTGDIELLNISDFASPIVALITTNVDCENTAVETDVITITIPANSLAVGDIIEIYYNTIRRHNSGVSVWFTQKLKINSTNIYNELKNIGNETTIYHITQKQQLIVTALAGNNITFRTYIMTSTDFTVGIGNSFAMGTNAYSDGATPNSRTLGSIDRTAVITIVLSAQWQVANANSWFRNDGALAYIIKKVV